MSWWNNRAEAIREGRSDWQQGRILRFGRSGTRDKFILLVGPGFYFAPRVWKWRLRFAFGGPYRPTLHFVSRKRFINLWR